jgi:REP element-mobilizing transposase RayT
MARTARVKEAYGTYYVTQSSSGCRPLFESNEDREYFINILQKTVNKFNCKVIDYCAQNNDTYHLIIDVNGGDLSKIMKSINIPYAMHAVCQGKLFKDRYKSQPIKDDDQLKQIQEEIRDDIAENGGYSSFCVTGINPCEPETESTCINCIATLDQAYDYLQYEATIKQMTPEEILKDKPLRNTLIKDVRRTSTLSLKKIGQVFGGISESSVSKILNQ